MINWMELGIVCFSAGIERIEIICIVRICLAGLQSTVSHDFEDALIVLAAFVIVLDSNGHLEVVATI